MTDSPAEAQRRRDLAWLRRVRDRIDRRQAAGAMAGIPPCVAKQVSRPVRTTRPAGTIRTIRNREAPAPELHAR